MRIRNKIMLIVVFGSIFITKNTLAQNITLENSKVKLVTDGKHISSLFDKARNYEHISSDYISANGLLGVTYLDAANFGSAVTINANVLTVVVLNSSASHANFSMENSTIKASVGVSLGATDTEFSWTINVELKNTGYVLSQVDFPRFRTPQQYNGNFKQFLEPCVEGQTRLLSQAIQYWRVYPGAQTVQIGIVTFPVAGFSMWCDDTKGNAKSFGYMTGNGSANFAVRHFLPFNYSNWQASYATKISLHGKDWQEGADIYRNWASKQFWCATKLKDRTDVSALLHSPPLVISTQVEKENLTTIVSRMKSWADKFDCKVIYRPLGWEKYGNWVGPDYFPIKIGDAQFTKLNADLKAAGISVAGFPEPYHWVTGLTDGTSQVNSELSAYYTNNNGTNLCRTQIDGKVWAQTNEKRITSFLCRGTDYGKTYFQTLSNKLFDMGVTHIHNDADHMIGLGGPCHNPAHGHPIAYGNWEAETMNTVFGEIKAEAKRRGNNDFILSRENGYEIQNMILTGYQTRNFHIISERKNILPLFLYIYHDYIPSIFGLASANAKRNIQLAALIVYGQVPSIAFWSTFVSEPTTNVIDQISADVLKDYYEVMKTHGKNFLLYGHLLRPAVQSAPGTLHNTWQDDQGNIGIFAIDTLDNNTTIAVKIPGSSKKYMTIYNGKTLVSSEQVKGGDTYSWTLPKWRLSSLIFSDSPLTSNKPENLKSINPIFPNPVTDVLNIRMNGFYKEWEVEVFDMAGKSLIKEMNANELALGKLQSGLYLVQVRTSAQSFMQKIVKI